MPEYRIISTEAGKELGFKDHTVNSIAWASILMKASHKKAKITAVWWPACFLTNVENWQYMDETVFRPVFVRNIMVATIWREGFIGAVQGE